MKITIKFPRREIRGHRCVETTIYTVDWNHDSYTNQDRPLYRIVWKPVTLVDYDFQAARRLKGLGRLAFLIAAVATLIPIMATLSLISKAIGAHPGKGLMNSFRAHLNDIVGA